MESAQKEHETLRSRACFMLQKDRIWNLESHFLLVEGAGIQFWAATSP